MKNESPTLGNMQNASELVSIAENGFPAMWIFVMDAILWTRNPCLECSACRILQYGEVQIPVGDGRGEEARS